VLLKIVQLKHDKKLLHRNLVISIPPGHTKTLIVNVLRTAWIWVSNPSIRSILGSTSQMEANKRNTEVREIMESRIYKAIAKDVTLQSTDTKWIKTNKQGGRVAVTTDVAKRFTGMDADDLIIDDPNDTTATMLDLQKVLDWFDKKALRRLRKGNLGFTLIQQRTNNNDLTAHVLKTQKSILHIVLRAYEEEEMEIKIPLIDGTFYIFKRPAGWLWNDPEMITKYEEIKELQIVKSLS
jgi:hypothetical protein